MSSPAKHGRTSTLTTVSPNPPSPNTTLSTNDVQDDFQAFQLRPVIRDFKLCAELFASNGDIVLICGRGNQENKGMLLVAYEIPSTSSTISASVRLLKVIKLTKKSVTQLETVPIMKLALFLGDGQVTLLEIDSLVELATIPTANVTLFSTWYDITPGTPVSASASAIDKSIIPTELRICAANKRRSLFFHQWSPQQRRIEENRDLRGAFELIDTPRALALSREKVCVGFRRSYIIMNLSTGMIENELPINVAHEPVITCLQDRTQWCVQIEMSTIFFDANFKPLYDDGVTWKDVPSAIVQSKPYVLALMGQSIDVCTFNGSQAVPVQQIAHKGTSTAGKCRLWMDARTERIYAATPTDVVILEPIPVQIQLQNYTGMYRYDLALILIRAVLGMSVSSSANDQARTNDGHARGNLDTNLMPKDVLFNNDDKLTKSSSDVDFARRQISTENIHSRSMNPISDTTLWHEYYRVGTMYAFQLFHKQQFEQAFAEFNEFLTDPCDIVALFPQLSAETWLTRSCNELRTFINQHRHFAGPNELIGLRLESALRELQRYLTDLRRVFQTIVRRSPDTWLEVQSLVQNRLILKPVRGLFAVVETALLKVYLIDNNNTLANALLRNQDNCCLPSEVEKELKKHHRRVELISFYEKQNRHREALELIAKMDSSSRETILNYLSKLDNEQLPLIFEYARPIISAAVQETDNEELIHDILTLFVGEITPISPSFVDTPGVRTIKLDCLQVYTFLKEIDGDLAIVYMENICSKPELGIKRRDIHNRLVFAYCDRIKQLNTKIQTMRKVKQETHGNEEQQEQTFRDNDMLASSASQKQSSPPSNSSSPTDSKAFSSTKIQLTAYKDKLKTFLLSNDCQCDFDKMEAYFLQENNDSTLKSLFSIHYGIVLGKLGRHELALETFVKNGFFTDAELYCESIYSNGQIILARQLYRKLLEWYLQQATTTKENREHSMKHILRIVNNTSERLDPVQTLEILPDQLELKNVRDFVEHSLRTCSTSKRSSEIERNLLFLKLLRTQSQRIESENHSFTIDADVTCARDGCTQPFTGTQAAVRFPHDKIVHLHCRAKYEKELETSNKKRR